MAGIELASAYVTLLPDGSQIGSSIRRELRGAEGDARRSGRRMGDNMASGVQNSMKGAAAAVGKMFAGLAVAGFAGNFFKDAVGGASDLNEAGTKLNQIFGKDGAAAIDKFASGGAKKLGQTKLAVLDAAGTFGVFGKSAGLSGTKLAGFSTEMASLATDLASFHNTSPEQAVEALGAALRGEAEPMRQYGVLLDDATMRQEALKLGLIKSTKEALTPANKVLAARSLIMKQTSDAQGDFAKTSGGLANQQRILSASWSDFKTQLGTYLLPLVTKVVSGLSGMTSSLADNLGPAIDRTKNALKPLGSAISQVWGILTEGDFKSGFLSEDSPVVDFFFTLREAIVNDVIPAAKQFGTFITTTVLPAAAKFGEYVGRNIVPALQRFGAFLMDTIVPAVRQFAAEFGPVILSVLQQFGGFITNSMLPTFQKLAGIVMDTIVPAVETFIRKFIDDALPILRTVGSFITDTLVPNVLQLADTIYKNVVPIVQAFARQIAENILPALSDLWNIISTKAIPALKGIADVVIPVVRWLGELVANILGKVIPVLIDWAGPIIGGVIRAFGDIISKVSDFVGRLIGWGKSIYTFAQDMWTVILLAKDSIVGSWNSIRDKFQAVVDWVKATWSATWALVKGIVTKPIEDAWSVIQTTWGYITGGFQAGWDWVSGFFKRAWNGVKTIFTDPVQAAKNTISNILGPLGLEGTFYKIWGYISGAFKRVWNGLKKIFTDPVDAAKTAISNILGATGLQKVFTDAKNAIGRIWDGLKSKLATPINAVIGIVNNPFISGFNSILSKVPGLSWRIPSIPTIKLATGGVLPGYTPGRDVHDFYSPTGGRLSLSGGEAIMRPEFTRALGAGGVNALNALARTGGVNAIRGALGGHQAFARGGIWDDIKDAGGKVLNKVKDVAGAAFDFVNPVAWLKKGANALLGRLGISGLFGDIAKGSLRKVIDSAAESIKDIFTGGGANGVATFTGSLAGGVQRWAGVASAAMAAAGLPQSYLPLLLHRMQVESGGNPYAINLWDSNAKLGIPSKGLMQTIDPTFNAYAGPYRSRGVYDPFANIYAAIKYTLSRYGIGGIGRAWGGSMGYAQGGVIPKFDNGGILAPGLNLVKNDLGKPEPLVRPEYQGAARFTKADLAELRQALYQGAYDGTAQRERDMAGRTRAAARLGGGL